MMRATTALAPLLLLLLWMPFIDADEDNPVTSRFHCLKNGCCDHHEWCRFWASVGECKTNAEWMVDNCQISCNTCGHVKKTTAVKTRPRRPIHPRPAAVARPHTVPATTTTTSTTRLPVTNVTHRPTFHTTVTRRPPSGARTLSPPQHRQFKKKVTRKFFHFFVDPPRRPMTPAVAVRTTVSEGGASSPTTAVMTSTSPRITTMTTTTTVTPSTTTVRPTTTSTTVRPSTTTSTTTTTTTVRPTTTTTTVRPTTITTTTIRPTTTTTTTVRPTTTTTTVRPTTTTTTVRPTTTTTTTMRPTTTTSTTTVTTSTPRPTTAASPPAESLEEEEEDDDEDQFVRTTTRRPAPQRRPPFRPRQQPQAIVRATVRPRLNTSRRPAFVPTTTTTTTRRTTTTTTTFFTQPTTAFVDTVTQPTTRSFISTPQSIRCRDIINDPVVAAEDMWRERLVVAVEDNSRRQTVDLDQVIRSNTANACTPRLDEADCEANMCYNALYRTMDGTCNNMRGEPLRGASYRPYTRLLPTVYDNELSEPVGSLFPDARPSPREITRKLTSSHASVESPDYNALIMQFGQFISHDMAKTTLVPSAKCNVCQNITSRCMSVPLAFDEPNANFRQTQCIRVSRSSPICGSGNRKPRQQLNENTGYIDASPIYGSSVHDSQKFRDGSTGFMKLPVFNGMQFLPFDQNNCRNPRNCKVIFTAGDSRVNLFVGLSAWHTIFTKEHNRIVTAFKRLNPHWDGERLYQEARKLVGAQMQAIVYREWLPKVLGAAFQTVVGEYHGYDPEVDSTVANEFTSGAFRFGHGMIQEVYQRLDQSFRNISVGALPFQKGTLHSDVLVNEGGVDPLIRGMFSQNVKRPQRITTTVTENMFGSTDLSSINIQRGRDHGHPAYVKYRELCGMGTATSFDHLSREILDTGTRRKLREIYGSVDRIDLWVGALLEDPIVRGLVGPTVACIIGPQFKRTRDGDRFYYENPGIFSRRQLVEIRKSSLSRIICDNTNTITTIPREAFRVGHMVPCSQIPSMDLSKWREV